MDNPEKLAICNKSIC